MNMISRYLNRAKYLFLAFLIFTGVFIFFEETQACSVSLGPTGSIQTSSRCEDNYSGLPNYIADFNGSWTVSGGFSGSGNTVLCVGNRNGSGTSCDIATYNNAGNATGGIGANCPNSSCDFADLTVTSINTVTLSATANPRFVIFGCTDPAASNYNPFANTNDGSCIYPTPPIVCGNGIVESGEVCDGGNFNGATCGTYGFAGGNLSCINNCQTISSSGCGRNKCIGGTGCSFVTGDTGGHQCSPPTDNVCLGVPPSPTVTILCNGSATSCTISSGSSAIISWTSTNATSCSVSPGGWSGTSGSQSTGPLASNTTYTVNCTGAGGNAASNVAVIIGAGGSTPPIINNVWISSPVVVTDGATIYDIVIDSFDASGGANIAEQYVYINEGGSNAGQYRGMLGWNISNVWPGIKDYQACTGGGFAGIHLYDPYVELDSCSTSSTATTRTNIFRVKFNPVFTTPLANNDISGLSRNAVGGSNGNTYQNFDINFSLFVSASTCSPTANVTWKNVTSNVTASGNSVTKTGGVDLSWDGAAHSVQTIASGDGCVEFSTGEINKYKFGGLSVDDGALRSDTFRYSIYPQGGGDTLRIYELGVNVGAFTCAPGRTAAGLCTYVAGDIFQISLESGVMKYYQNGSLLYTSSLAPVYPMVFKTDFYNTGASITNVKMTPSSPANYITQGLATAPGGLVAGQLVTFSGTVRNSGTGPASVTSSTRLYININNDASLDDVVTTNQTTNALVAGATEVESWTNAWTAVAGNHSFRVCADSGNAITESDEGDNCTTQTFTVGAAPTLTVSFSASPGAVTLGQSTDLSALVGGTATGTINYNIWWDCAYADATPTVAEANASCGPPVLSNNCAANQTLGYKCDAQAATSLTRAYTYLSAGTKRPFAIVERGGLSAMATTAGGVTVTSPAPTVSNATVTVSNSNYCSAGVHATVGWTYVPAGSPPQSNQVAYEVQIDDDLDPLTGSPEWEQSGTTGTSAVTTPCNTSNPITSPQTNCRMNWGTIYRAWVRVQNGFGQWSPWTLMSTYCNGGACGAATSWTTPAHTPPNLKPDPGFSITPPNPSLGSPVIFDDLSPTFDPTAIFGSWSWNFGDGSITNGTDPIIPLDVASTNHTYVANGSYTVRLTVEDELGISCSNSSLISIQKAIPIWREVAPR